MGSERGVSLIEAKFNPYHDESGRFTTSSGAVAIARKQPSSNPKGAGPVSHASSAPQRSSSRTVRQSKPAAEIPGYPEIGRNSWRASNDYAFEAAANFYNKKYGLRRGDSDYKTPEFLKAWAMRESGGEGDRSAFSSDPFQVNVPGDWAPEKTRIAGLRRGQRMTPAISVYAALEWLRQKSLIRDGRGQVIGRRSVQRSLEKYNGRSDHSRQSGNETHGEWYARTILNMARQAERVK